jgi:hypothetical protein
VTSIQTGALEGKNQDAEHFDEMSTPPGSIWYTEAMAQIYPTFMTCT